MDGLTLRQAETWAEVALYSNAIKTCIAPGNRNEAAARESWEHDLPRPIYVLIDLERGSERWQGYIRFLPVAVMLYSDYYGIAKLDWTSVKVGSFLSPSDHQAIFLAAVSWLGVPCLTTHNTYGGERLYWIGSKPAYRRVNTYPEGAMWLVMPPDGVKPPLVPVTSTLED